MQLYQLSRDYLHLMNQIEDQEGEIFDDQYELMQVLKDEGAEKIESLAKMVLNLKAEAGTRTEESKRQMAIVSGLKSRAFYLEGYILSEMKRLDLQEAKGDTLTVKRPKPRASVSVVRVESVPADYMREIPAKFEPDKKKMLDFFKESGNPVPGTEIAYNESIKIK